MVCCFLAVRTDTDADAAAAACVPPATARARRLAALAPSARAFHLLAAAERRLRNTRAWYDAALRGVAASQRERSSILLFEASHAAAAALMDGALGPG
jgi:hypothetical protein